MNLDPRQTEAQTAAVARMLAAPAGGWKVTGVVGGICLGVQCSQVAVRIESAKLNVWGVVMPDGSLVKPEPGRKRIKAVDVVFNLM